MAEEKPQTPQVGIAGRNQNQAPQTGVPGVQQPPVPTAEQIQEVMRRQQQETQQQIAEAKKRAGYDSNKTSAPQSKRFSQKDPNPKQQPQTQPQTQPQPQPQPRSSPQPNPMSQVPPNIAASMPPTMRPDMTDEEILAGHPRNTIAQHAQREEEVIKEKIPWFPIRGPGESASIELTDSIIMNVPSRGMIGEADAAAKVVLSLLSEILAIRERLDFMEQNGARMPEGIGDLSNRVYQLEATLFEQRNALRQSARGVREQIEIFQSKGMSPDEILSQLSGQQIAAENIVKNKEEDK